MRKYFYAALAAAVAIPAVVVPVQATETTNVTIDFKDVPKTHSSYEEIMKMRAEGIINGYQDNTFRPGESITRQHVAALISRALPLDPIREAIEFPDVPKTHPYYEDIQRLYRAGIIDGKQDGTFDPSGNLTRSQMAKILCLAFELELEKGYIFEDVGADDWAKDYIATLYVNGITTGSNGKYDGNKTVTRAHYAVFLYRSLYPELAPTPEKPLSPEPITPEPAPQPTPSTPSEDGVAVLPNPDKVVKPTSWAEEKIKEYEQIIDETVYTHSPLAGSGSMGVARMSLKFLFGNAYFSKEETLEGLVEGINNRGGNITVDNFVRIVNHVVKTGELYVDPNNIFAMYYNYEDNYLYKIM